MKLSFETNLPIISRKRFYLYIFALLLILIVDLLLYKPIKINKTYTSDDLSYLSNIPNISVSSENDIITITNDDNNNILSTYNCNNHMCEVVDTNNSTNQLLIYDKKYLIFNYVTNEVTKLNISNIEYDSIGFVGNSLFIKDKDKYALYSIDDNKYITNYIYEGIVNTNNTHGAFISNSKYNQKLDIVDNNTITKTYNHCVRLQNNNDKLLCSEHVEGNLTNEEVDRELDIVLSQYPNLNDIRLFLIKSGIETVGLPYLWGGGHGTLENTLDIANKDWNNKQIYISNGFKNQEAGKSYPAGLDCAGFVRWLYYIASDVDLYRDRVNVISGRNTDVYLINENELLPGDIILDKDHVVIYLYKDINNKPISVHASYDHLQVEISNYKKGNTYYRLNNWK